MNAVGIEAEAGAARRQVDDGIGGHARVPAKVPQRVTTLAWMRVGILLENGRQPTFPFDELRPPSHQPNRLVRSRVMRREIKPQVDAVRAGNRHQPAHGLQRGPAFVVHEPEWLTGHGIDAGNDDPVAIDHPLQELGPRDAVGRCGWRGRALGRTRSGTDAYPEIGSGSLEPGSLCPERPRTLNERLPEFRL